VTYTAALQKLFALRRFGVKPGLATTAALVDGFSLPPVAHIAGTNGKGSTAAMLAALLGPKVGLYTSPHLLRFTERFVAAGVEMPSEIAAQLVDEVLADAARLGLEATFFEVATAMAWRWFSQQQLDAVVLECGLGGRWDSTNVCTPRVTVVTGIARDHTEVLGSSLAEIAAEKAGIFKPGAPAVIACRDERAREVLLARAAEVGAPALLLGRDFAPAEVPLSLAGAHQADNAALAICAATQFGVTPDVTRLSSVRWPGRLERLADDVIADGAHNPDGAAALAAALPSLAAGRPIHLVLGVVTDKDAVLLAHRLVRLCTRLICTQPPSLRAMPAAELALRIGGESIPDLAAALTAARRPGALTVVAGSLFLVGEARRLLLGEPADPLTVQDPPAQKQAR
jgi:dihydrofolate synthase/folylpolyglutamate synthase